MAQPKHAMEIFQFLDKSNCRECGEKTCLAFAGSVFRGQKKIEDCPRLDRKIIERFSDNANTSGTIEQNRDEYVEKLKAEIGGIDLAAAAERTGGRFENGRLTLKILGKDFSVDSSGKLSADIHINPWVVMPFLDYVLNGKGRAVTGQWVSFRELKQGWERYPLFRKRCEEPIKQVADAYPGLFDDMVHLFSGKQVEKQFKSDISVVLHPLPRVPVMVCYWMPEDGLESSLNLYFDKATDDNLDIGSTFSLGAGLAQMFEKIALRHGVVESVPST